MKTKFSFMPEGQQREVEKGKTGENLNLSSGARGHSFGPGYLWSTGGGGRANADASRSWI